MSLAAAVVESEGSDDDASVPRTRISEVASAVARHAFAIVVVAGGTAAAAYALLGLRVYRSLHATAFDLAFFDQILWNTAHGRWFQTTYTSYNFLGQHFEPLLLPLAALYRLGAGPQTLIGLQDLAVGAAAVPLFYAGRRLLGSGAAALLASGFLLSPTLQRGLDFGFHPDLFEPLLVFSALAALLASRHRTFLACTGVLLLVKEDAFLLALALGWVWALRGDRRTGLIAVAVALAWGILVLGVLMPLFRAGQPSDLAERYGYLGNSAAEIVRAAVLHPGRVLDHLGGAAPVTALLGLLGTLAFLPLFAPDVLVAAAPPALVALLSTHPPQRTLDLQYGIPLLTLAVVAALFGLARLRGWLEKPSVGRILGRSLGRRLAAAPAFVLLVAAAVGAVLHGPFLLDRGVDAARFRDDGQGKNLADIAALIPPDASLSAQTGLAPHLSHRRVQWEFPRLKGAEFVIVQDGGVRSSQSQVQFDETLAALPGLGYHEVARAGAIRLYGVTRPAKVSR